MSATAELARSEAYFLNDTPVTSRDRIVTGREVLDAWRVEAAVRLPSHPAAAGDPAEPGR